jgi:hypothetical protein
MVFSTKGAEHIEKNNLSMWLKNKEKLQIFQNPLRKLNQYYNIFHKGNFFSNFYQIKV